MKTPTVQFYKAYSYFAWCLQDKTGRTIAIPHRHESTHGAAIRSFKRVAEALNARGPWEIRDGPGVKGSHAMLTK